MKNFPHQFNDLAKLFNALVVLKELVDNDITLTDDNFGEALTRQGIYTFRDKTLTIDDFLAAEAQKPRSNRGYLTVARDIKRLFQLLGFVDISTHRLGLLSLQAIQLLNSASSEIRTALWKDSFSQLALTDTHGNISHPYRILLRIVQDSPGIETKKLLLALEAKDDSPIEYARILQLSNLNYDQILDQIATSSSMASNAVKILPGIAEQLGDIYRQGNHTFPVGQVFITEDEIATEIPDETFNADGILYSQFREVTADNIAKDPIFQQVSSVSIDLTESIRLRQDRLAQHQDIVRKVGLVCQSKGFTLFEGKIDCLAVKDGASVLFEVKTIFDKKSDQEKQTVKGIGQLKYYGYSIVKNQMGYENIKPAIVYSKRPLESLLEFCLNEAVTVIWIEHDAIKMWDAVSSSEIDFDPLTLVH